MAYTINANAKNVWIRDNENTRDLSIQTDASSVYLENGRTLEQELGEGSMVSNVATVDTSMSKVIDGTLDGAYESLVFKGKSLVNVAQPFDRGITDVWATIHLRHSLLKQSTKYYYQVFDLPSGFQHVFTNSDGSTFLGTYTTNNISTFTTNLELTSDRIVLHINDGGKNALTQEQLGKIKVMVIEYQEGMENWDIPYFEGLCDVKMPILRNVGKNLFDGQLKLANFSGGTGNEVSSNSHVMSVDFIGIKPSTQYYFSCGNGFNSTAAKCILWYDKNKVFINHVNEKGMSPSNAHYCRLRTRKDDSTVISESEFKSVKMQLEESSTVTSYEDYKTNILRTSEEIVLCEVGEVCDTYNPLTGEYIKRIGEIMLDGSDDESWTIYTNGREKTIQFRFDMKSTAKGQSDYTKIISSHLPSVDIINNNDIEGVSIYSNGNIYISLLRTKAETLSSLKSYLQSNPITVQYELAEPITTIVEPSTIPFAYQNGHVILESGSEEQSLLPTLEYSTVVNRTGQVESVAKTIQTQEKQLTMLEQMLIQNIIELDYNNTVLALNLEINEVM